VNGVINVITKNARDTQGGLVDLKAGPVDQNGLVRYGGRFGENGAYRVYGMGFGTGHTDLPGGASARDDWHGGQAGFRTDWQGLDDGVTLTGDFYRNNNALDGRQYGGNVMGRWTHRFADGSDLLLQSSYDRQHRVAPGVSESYDSYDLQAQQTLYLGRHVVVLGGEYRIVRDDFLNNSNIFVLIPQRRTVGVGDLFVQDTFALTEDLKLTFGTKVEDSTYTGFSFLPSVRLGWTVSENTFLWAAISRAVRTPSRIDRELTASGILAPALDFRSETLTAYEIGYRGRPTPTTSLSVSLYYNVYDDLRTTGLSGISGLPLQLQNGAEGTTYGMEAWGDWRVVPWWRLSAGVNLLHKDLRLKPGAVELSGWRSEGYDPGYQLSFRSSMDLAHGVELDVGVRAVSSLTYAPINGYVDADARIGWHVNERLELSLAGYNLFGPHAETIVPAYPAFQARRSVYLGLRWKF
jgi:iron complex outermembrane receptor protein